MYLSGWHRRSYWLVCEGFDRMHPNLTYIVMGVLFLLGTFFTHDPFLSLGWFVR